MQYTYKTKTVCAQRIHFEINGNVITNIRFEGGCNGNLKAISKLVDGWTVEQIEEKLKGNTCGMRPTSCADQLALAVRTAYEETK
ncbi:MAG: TIGR03905 family TSCPD domain-containing protein [Oscillospiraceae bacterium]|nr:TIGR03905 family TSCPD domain-containing protein [Oscillospiraceae bacterium]